MASNYAAPKAGLVAGSLSDNSYATHRTYETYETYETYATYGTYESHKSYRTYWTGLPAFDQFHETQAALFVVIKHVIAGAGRRQDDGLAGPGRLAGQGDGLLE